MHTNQWYQFVGQFFGLNSSLLYSKTKSSDIIKGKLALIEIEAICNFAKGD